MTKNEKKFILTCDCGCSNGIEFRGWTQEDDDQDNVIYASFFKGMFYAEQKSPIGQITSTIDHLRSNCFFDIVVTREDLKDLRCFLNSVKCGNAEIKNELSLTICVDMFSNDSEPMYAITLTGMPKFTTFITGKTFRNYEILINEKMRKTLIKAINSTLQ